MTIKRLRASSVSTGSRSSALSRIEAKSKLDGVAKGVGRAEEGVGGEVAVGMVYESRTSMRSRVMVAMIG